MLKSRYLPDADRLSVLAATILLAYTLSRFIDLPGSDVGFQLPGIYVSLHLSIRTLVYFLVAGLVASGADWLLRDHPALKDQSTFQHWLLPALTAWVIGIPLSQLPMGILWWSVFAIGGALLVLVLVAEYIVVDPNDVRRTPAAAGLTAVSYALFLILGTVLRSAGLRLYLILPAMAISAGLVAIRTLQFSLHGEWRIIEAGVVTLIIAQVVAALHYWPLSPISFGLAVLGPAYALTTLISSLSEGEPLRQAVLGPGVVLLGAWGAAAWLR